MLYVIFDIFLFSIEIFKQKVAVFGVLYIILSRNIIVMCI